MLRVSIDEVRPGMRLAQSVFSGGRMLLASGVLLSRYIISRLKSHGIRHLSVYLDDQWTEDFITQEMAEHTYNALISEAHYEIDRIIKDQEVVTYIREIVKSIIEFIKENKKFLYLMLRLRSHENYIFGHSVGVCVVSIILGQSLGFKKKELLTLGIGALVHDIGKLSLSKEILDKPGKLNDDEWSQVKKHPWLGFEITKKLNDIPPQVSEITLQHHERLDGSGYPNQIVQDTIGRMSRIVAVADVYDALNTDRIYRPKYLPHEVMEIMVEMSGSQLDQEIVDTLFKEVGMYLPGTLVELNTGQQAIVLDCPKHFPNRPRVLIQSRGFDYALDLLTHPNIAIVNTKDSERDL